MQDTDTVASDRQDAIVFGQCERWSKSRLSRISTDTEPDANASDDCRSVCIESIAGRGWNAASQREATELLLTNLPGQSEENFYYFYYATLALFQQQGDAWLHGMRR